MADRKKEFRNIGTQKKISAVSHSAAEAKRALAPFEEGPLVRLPHHVERHSKFYTSFCREDRDRQARTYGSRYRTDAFDDLARLAKVSMLVFRPLAFIADALLPDKRV
jgi:hypothetical protein